MMTENPYQVSNIDLLAASVGGSPTDICLFRQGNMSVIHQKATFPDRCIKSNEPTTNRLRCVLHWHLPVLYLLMIAPILYVIVALLVGKKAEFYVPLSERFIARRRSNMRIAVVLLLAGVVAFCIGIALIDSSEPNLFILGGCLMLLGPGLWLAACALGIYGCRIISARYIDDHFAKVTGIGSEFLASLPEWPHANL